MSQTINQWLKWLLINSLLINQLHHFRTKGHSLIVINFPHTDKYLLKWDTQVLAFIHSTVCRVEQCKENQTKSVSLDTGCIFNSKNHIKWQKQWIFICSAHSQDSTPCYCSQIIVPPSNITPHEATRCCVIAADKDCGEFRVSNLAACQPEQDSHCHSS